MFRYLSGRTRVDATRKSMGLLLKRYGHSGFTLHGSIVGGSTTLDASTLSRSVPERCVGFTSCSRKSATL